VAIAASTAAAPLQAGIYSSIDNRMAESRYSPDYDVFGAILGDLATISATKPASNPPIRQRYLLIEALGQGTRPNLDSLGQKINYSAVLLRRGRAHGALQFLQSVSPRNFVVESHDAMAHFLTETPDLEEKSLIYMKRALEKWPKSWSDLNEDQQNSLKSLGWDFADFDRYRKCEVYLQRLMIHRLDEKKKRQKKLKVDDMLDPIFLNAKNEPIRFRNEKGEYDVGKIAAADKEQLYPDFVDDVQQLLLWMPSDKRLLWLLAEAYNASAMFKQNPKDKLLAIHSANKVFKQLRNFEFPAEYGRQDIADHHQMIEAYVAANPLDVFVLPPDVEDPNDVKMTSTQWYRTLAIAIAIGVAVGMLALWQVQEWRRRRQGRA
jgi:hypothetical protein